MAPGREVRCGILAVGGQLRCLPLEEYPVTVDSPVRLAQDKVEGQGTVAGGSGLRLVAKTTATAWVVDPADPVTEQVWAAARRCHTALRCRHHSLFDFRIDPAGQAWFLEAGLYCSFSPQSVIPTMARAAGMRLDALFAASLAEART